MNLNQTEGGCSSFTFGSRKVPALITVQANSLYEDSIICTTCTICTFYWLCVCNQFYMFVGLDCAQGVQIFVQTLFLAWDVAQWMPDTFKALSLAPDTGKKENEGSDGAHL